MKLSPLFSASSPWLAIYSITVSLAIAPKVTVKYFLAQRCWPQNLLLRTGFSCNNLLNILPFRYCASFDTEICGGTEMKICPLIIWTWYVLQISRIKSRVLSPRRPSSTDFRYLVVHTRWYLKSKTVWGSWAIQFHSYSLSFLKDRLKAGIFSPRWITKDRQRAPIFENTLIPLPRAKRNILPDRTAFCFSPAFWAIPHSPNNAGKCMPAIWIGAIKYVSLRRRHNVFFSHDSLLISPNLS